MRTIKGPGGALNNTMLNNAFRFRGNPREIPNGYFRNTFLTRNKTMNYSVFNNNKLVGFAILKKGNRKWSLELIGTDPKKGIGRLLMTKIISDAKKSGNVNSIVLEPVASAIDFYKHLGFKPTNSQFTYAMNIKR
jgi:ribosomal protein S18 acetylase RimI-like enzyme